MQYSPEFETDNNVKKVRLSVGTLYFVPTDSTGLYRFCSNNPKLQEWCENVEDVGPIKDKTVPIPYYKFAVATLQDYLHNKPVGSHRRNSIDIIVALDKGEVVSKAPDNAIIVDCGALPVSIFTDKQSPDEIYKTTIDLGIVDHHTIDQLSTMANQPKKCSTEIVTDYDNEIADYCAEHDVSEIIIHRDSDLDAVCAAWLIREKIATGTLPIIAEKIAEIVHLVDYDDYRLQTDKYVTSFPGCLEAVMSEIKNVKKHELYSNPDNLEQDNPHYLNKIGLKKLRHLDSMANAEAFKILDVLAAEKENNQQFTLETSNIRNFILDSSQISDETKDILENGLYDITENKNLFDEIIAEAEVLPFKFINPLTQYQEEGQVVIVHASDPLMTASQGYTHFGRNTVMAVYGGLNRQTGDMYNIGISCDSSKILANVMKDICITINKIEEDKRRQIERICISLENQSELTPGEQKRLEDLRRSLWDLEDLETCEAFEGADQFDLINKDPSLLVADNTLIVASRHSLITEKCFADVIKEWAHDTLERD